MEPLTLHVHIATTDSVDADELAAVAARTFPLACPPSMAAENIASFIDANLSATRFAEYLADPQRAILTAQRDGRIVGYAMLIRGVDDDTDVQRAVEIRPAAELSKLYLLPDYHGAGRVGGVDGTHAGHRRRMGRPLRVAGRQPGKPTRTTLLHQERL